MLNARQSTQSPGEPKRVMAYCHDSVGIGHLRRTLSICERVVRRFPQTCFLLATGTPYIQLFKPLKRVDCIKLPALAKVDNGHYQAKHLSLPTEKLRRCREAMLLQAAQCFEPHVLLVDKAPLGVCRELVPTLTWFREERSNTRVIFGMRDIEDSPEQTISQWARDGVPEVLESCFDEVWVYGMRDLFDVTKQYRLSPQIQKKLRFMGYVCRTHCPHTPPAHGLKREIVVTVGGGTDGERMLSTYLAEAADRAAAAGALSTVIGGPDLPPEPAKRLRKQCARLPSVSWVEFEQCMSCRFQSADLVVSMGGYNTMCELAIHRKPAVIVPRIKPRLEQAMRASLWADRSAVSVLHPDQLTPQTLADRVIEMLNRHRNPEPPKLDVRGLDRVEERFQAFWCEEARDAAAVCV